MKFSGRIPNAICNIWGLMDLQTPAWWH
jgi:hypothetical protein